MSVRIDANRLTLLILGFICFIPIFKNFGISSSQGQFLINIALIIFSLILMLSFLKLDSLKILNISILVIFLGAVTFFLSIYYLSPFNRILSDVGRLVISGLIIGIGYVLASNEMFDEKRVIKFLLIYFLLSCLFSLLVFSSYSYPIVDLYKGRLSSDVLPFHFFRASGFFGYPTDFGCLMLLGILISLNSFSRNLFSKKSLYLFMFTFLIGIFMSLSRGAILQIFGIIFLYASFHLFKLLFSKVVYKSMLPVFVLIMSVLLPMLVFNSVNLRSLSGFEDLSIQGYILNALIDPDASTLHRFNELNIAREILLGNELIPIAFDRLQPFGFDVIEGAYTHYIIRFGILGLLILGSYFFLITFCLWRGRHSILGKSFLIWFLSYVIFVAPFSDVLVRLKGLGFYSLIIGLIAGIGLRQEIYNKHKN